MGVREVWGLAGWLGDVLCQRPWLYPSASTQKIMQTRVDVALIYSYKLNLPLDSNVINFYTSLFDIVVVTS